MTKTILSLSLLSLAACSFMARGEEQYRTDTRQLLETRSSNIRACYDQELAKNSAQSGTVVVTFTVEKKTGLITAVGVDPDQSTAPQGLQDCVITSLEGLQLTPEDRRDGKATFTFAFGSSGKPAA